MSTPNNTTITSEAPPKSSKLPLLISGSFILLLVACYFFWPAFQERTTEAWRVLSSGDQKRISGWVSQFGIWGPVVIVLCMVLQMFLVVVNVVALMVIAVLAYGPLGGSIISLFGIATASTVGYWIGHSLSPATVGKLLGKNTKKKVEDHVNRYGAWAIVVFRLSPLLSDDAISFVAGLVRMPYLRFMGATLAGVLPLAILIAYLGQDIDRLKTGLILVSVIASASLLVYYMFYRWICK